MELPCVRHSTRLEQQRWGSRIRVLRVRSPWRKFPDLIEDPWLSRSLHSGCATILGGQIGNSRSGRNCSAAECLRASASRPSFLVSAGPGSCPTELFVSFPPTRRFPSLSLSSPTSLDNSLDRRPHALISPQTARRPRSRHVLCCSPAISIPQSSIPSPATVKALFDSFISARHSIN